MIDRYQTKEMTELWSEEKRFYYWALVEKAVAAVQAELNFIPKEAAEMIAQASFKIDEIKEIEKETGHDVVAFVKSLENSIPKEEAKAYIHYGLTSYDIVDTAWGLQLKEGCEILLSALTHLKETIKKLALKYQNQPMIGRTHGIFAEPITFGLKCLSWYTEIERNIKRFEQAKEEVSYGKISGVVGTFSQLPPKVEELVLNRLGLKPELVATQVVPRDRYAFLISICALIASALERIATEIRNLQRSEIGEVSEPFGKGQKGSSAMPHKKNPIISERICSLARYLRALIIPSFENISLWHERDLTNSANERLIFPQVFTLLHYMIKKTTEILAGLEVNVEKMEENLKKTQAQYFSQLLLSSLVKKGLKRSRAYDMIQELSFKAMRENKSLNEVAKEDPELKRYFSEEELGKTLSLDNLLKNIPEIFKRTLKEI